jgi:transcriptional regulator with XRE-family HTH domain
MDPTPGPVLRRRQAGTRLRQLREAAGKSLNEVADYLECSAAKISRIETGRLPARVPDVRNMLDLYQVPEPQRAELLDLVRESRERGWWHTYTDIVADGFDTYIGLEDSAATIWENESYLVPGLLQTLDYAYAVQAHRMDLTEETAERYIEVRMRRQAILDRPRPPDLHFVLDESIPHRIVALGSAVARQQLHHIANLAQRPNITVQILPYAAGLGASNGSSFSVFGFPDPGDPKVVYLEGLTGSSFDGKIDTTARYLMAFDGNRSLALSPAESIAFLTGLAESMP